jgi:Rrf2 family protein
MLIWLVGNISQQYGRKRDASSRKPSVIRHNEAVRVSASLDYALRAMVELAAASSSGHPMKSDEIAARQGIPSRFLAQLLAELRRAKLVNSGRGYAGGYWLAVPPESVTVADIARVIDGPLADVHGMSPEVFGPPGVAAPTKELWVAVRAALRSVMEQVTIADLAAGVLPTAVSALLDDPDAWTRRPDPLLNRPGK